MISVVLPMYNEKAAIADELRGIRQTMDDSGLPYEIIVVEVHPIGAHLGK